MRQKNWSCPKKKAARYVTIIRSIKNHFGGPLPANLQYWTMSGRCSTHCGTPLNGCELDQLTQNKIITPNQFHGVDKLRSIIDINSYAYPKVKWFHGDFYETMKHTTNFNPGLVNADLIQTGEYATGAIYIAKIMELLTNRVNHKVILIANLMSKYRFYDQKDGDYILANIKATNQCEFAFRNANWIIEPLYYQYEGSGSKNGATVMTSIVMVKN